MIHKTRHWTAITSLFILMLPLVSAQITPNIWKKFIGEPVPIETPNLIDFSYAGYKNGVEGIPEDFTYTEYDVTDYGATPNDGKSDTVAIQKVLDAAAVGRSIVFFPPGQYDVILNDEPTNPIIVSGDNVIVKGSGAEGVIHGGTTIKIHNNLTDSLRLFQTKWRRNGYNHATRVKGTFPRGTMHFDVENVKHLVNRRFIEIQLNELNGDDWRQYSSRLITDMPEEYTNIRKGIKVYEIHEIDRIVGDRVYVKAPVLTHLNSNFTVNWRDLTVGVGFEDLHIDGNLQEPYQHLVQEGRGGITLWHTAHSWIRRCRFSNTINAFGHHSSYSSSALGIILDGRYGHVPGSVTVSTYCFIGLLTDYTDQGMWHGVQSASSSAGTVVWEIDGKKMRGPDTHGSMPRHSLFDNYNSINHHSSGGAKQNLPHHLDGYTRWNNNIATNKLFNLWTPGGYGFAITQGNLIGYKTLGGSIPRNAYFEGFGTRVSPDSLYIAQLERRLNTLPAWIDAAKEEYRTFFERILPAIAKTETTVTPSVDPDDSGPKIEGPWLWVLLPGERFNENTDLLAKVSGGNVSEQQIATIGALPGDRVGDNVWTSAIIQDSDGNNINNMIRSLNWEKHDLATVIYGSIALNSSRDQETRMHIGADDGVKVWLNGVLVREELDKWSAKDYRSNFPVTLKQGKNVLLVAVDTQGGAWSGFFGFQTDAEYTVLPFSGVGYAIFNDKIYRGDTFTLNLYAEGVTDFAGWQFDIEFDPAYLKAIEVRKGYFLETEGGQTSFHNGTIDNQSGKITGLSEVGLNETSVSGTGLLLSATFSAKSGGKTLLTLNNFLFSNSSRQAISAGPLKLALVLKGLLIWDVDEDGRVSILDMILVARDIGKTVSPNSQIDINGDGIINILDLMLVAQHIGESATSASPSILALDDLEGLDSAMVRAWIEQAQAENDGSLAFRKGIENLQVLLALLLPKETALLPNYPNPFNPETWIPYQLSKSGKVTLTIYSVNGKLVRTLALGQLPAGIYQSRSRAANWDGKNDVGESVSSGIYIVLLEVEDFSATQRMVILK